MHGIVHAFLQQYSLYIFFYNVEPLVLRFTLDTDQCLEADQTNARAPCWRIALPQRNRAVVQRLADLACCWPRAVGARRGGDARVACYRRVGVSRANQRTRDRPAPPTAPPCAASAVTRRPPMVVGLRTATRHRRPTSSTLSSSHLPRSPVELAERGPALPTVVRRVWWRRRRLPGCASRPPCLWSERGDAFDRTSGWRRARWAAHGSLRAGSGRLDAAALYDAPSAATLSQALSLPHGRAAAADAAQPVAPTVVGRARQHGSQGRRNGSCRGSPAGSRPSASYRGARPSSGWRPAARRCGAAGGRARCCAGDAARQGTETAPRAQTRAVVAIAMKGSRKLANARWLRDRVKTHRPFFSCSS